MTHSHPAGPILSQRHVAALETDANEFIKLGLVERRQNRIAFVIRLTLCDLYSGQSLVFLAVNHHLHYYSEGCRFDPPNLDLCVSPIDEIIMKFHQLFFLVLNIHIEIGLRLFQDNAPSHWNNLPSHFISHLIYFNYYFLETPVVLRCFQCFIAMQICIVMLICKLVCHMVSCATDEG